MDDIGKVLAFEIKKEIADRYFGFRRIIEKDTEAYLQKVADTALELEQNVGFDLVRIYILLKESSFILKFFELTGFRGDFFFESYVICTPAIRKQVFEPKKVPGWSRKKRYKNLFFEIYQELYDHILLFHKTLAELIEEHDVICEEIKIFYRKNDINMIMGLIRKFDSQGASGSAQQFGGAATVTDYEKKLKIVPPVAPDKQLPEVPGIPKLSSIKPALNKILDQSFLKLPDFDPKD